MIFLEILNYYSKNNRRRSSFKVFYTGPSFWQRPTRKRVIVELYGDVITCKKGF
jgi:hypothetical protein